MIWTQVPPDFLLTLAYTKSRTIPKEADLRLGCIFQWYLLNSYKSCYVFRPIFTSRKAGHRASTVPKNWKFVRVCTICTSPYPYKNRPSYRKIVLNRTFVDALTMTYTDLLHCIPNNDHVQVEQYMHMFYQVSIRYLTILAGFLPLFVAFAACLLGNWKHLSNM